MSQFIDQSPCLIKLSARKKLGGGGGGGGGQATCLSHSALAFDFYCFVSCFENLLVEED